MLKYIKRNPVNTAFTVGILGCLAFSSGNISQNLGTLEHIKKTTQYNATKQLELQASQQNAAQQSDIAIERYKNGCLLLTQPLIQGQPVYNTKGKPLPRGTVVCDQIGNTAKLIPRDFDGDGVFVPVVGELAYTGNREAVQDAIASNQAMKIYQ
ncbi:hypothetical protein [Calothrix sp. NIES-2098]|uniref:hypothetical protein n=1 Tax=Calothrix sp. NIES-2098 TaxID=1954171 RepID=UPI000B6197B3|nr:hypothetical protein NIES2098_42060 [Calothrix sp. NIES-2098]